MTSTTIVRPTSNTAKKVNSFLNHEVSTESMIEKKIRDIFQFRGGFHKLQQRQIFINVGSANKTFFTRLQHISMLHADKAMTTAGTILYEVDTYKQNINSVKSYHKKLRSLNVARNTQRLNGTNFHYKQYVVTGTIERTNLNLIKLELPTFIEMKESLMMNGDLDELEIAFALSYLSYLAKCLGKNPQFKITDLQTKQIMQKDIFWYNRTLCLAWKIAVDQSFNASDL